jgi:hypothetical protein
MPTLPPEPEWIRLCALLRHENKIHAMIPVLRLIRRRLPGKTLPLLLDCFARGQLRSHPFLGGLPSDGEMGVAAPDLEIVRNGERWEILVDDGLSRSEGGLAGDFLEALVRREELLRRIGERILERQREFLEFGIPSLRPMTQFEIALDLAMAPSTISRAVEGKYVRTPHGTFPLKQIFSRTRESSSLLGDYFRREILQNNPSALLWPRCRLAMAVRERLSRLR